jgi:putative FmdB family regulatory protein
MIREHSPVGKYILNLLRISWIEDEGRGVFSWEVAMPLFEFECQGCGTVFECRISGGNSPAARCPACNSEDVERLWSPFSSPSGSSASGCGGARLGGFG